MFTLMRHRSIWHGISAGKEWDFRVIIQGFCVSKFVGWAGVQAQHSMM